jgi:hypothetical protein
MLMHFKDSPEPPQPGMVPPVSRTRSCIRASASAIQR